MKTDVSTQKIREYILFYLASGFIDQENTSKALSYLDFIDIQMSLAMAKHSESVYDEMH